MKVKRLHTLLAVVLFLFAAGCAGTQSTVGLATPATFSGVIPCADCPGIEITLTLRPDSLFFLRQVYQEAEVGADRTFVQCGTWTGTTRSQVIALSGGDFNQKLKVVDSTSIRWLDRSGDVIRSQLNYDLKAVSTIDPLPDAVVIRGMFRYMADAGIFTFCQSRHQFPVAQKANNALLERMYLATRGEAGADLLVLVEARLERLAAMEGDRFQDMLVVDRVLGMWTDRSCEVGPSATLENTYWQLVSIEDRIVEMPEEFREPYLQFIAGEELSVSGFTGCNSLRGSVRLDGSTLSFGDLAVTKMLCQPVVDIERRFLAALQAVTSYTLEGDTLTMSSAGTKVLVFHAAAQ